MKWHLLDILMYGYMISLYKTVVLDKLASFYCRKIYLLSIF